MTTDQKAPLDIAPRAQISERILTILFVAGCFTIGITILDRILGGGWRSFGSMLSSFLLAAYALVPVWGFADFPDREQRSWTIGATAGSIVGLVYGLIVRSILPGVFFGACVGAGSSSLCERLLGKGSLGKQLGAVAVGLVAAHFLGLLPPTKLIRSGKQETVGGGQQESITEAQKNDENEIDAPALLNLAANASRLKKKFPGRFVVAGRVLKIEDHNGAWGRKTYTVSLVGTHNSKGLVDSWIECEMSNDGGLENISRGEYVKIEGEFDRAVGSDFVFIKKGRLSPKYHQY